MQRINDPSYLNPADLLNRGFRSAPKYTLPDGRHIALFVKPNDLDPNDSVGRGGVDAIRNEGTADANRFVWLESKSIFSGGGGSYGGLEYTPAQWETRATQIQLFRIEIDEFMEGQRNVPTDSAQYKAFTAKRARMYEAAGRQRVNFMCYGNFDMPAADNWKIEGVYQGPLNQRFKNAYVSKAQARAYPRLSNYFAQGHDNNCWPSIKYYPETPYTQSHYGQFTHAVEVLANAMDSGSRWGLVSAPLIESLPGTVSRPGGATHINVNYARRVGSPAGTVTTTPHPQYDFDLAKALVLMTLDRATDVIGWDVPVAVGVNPNTIHKASGPEDSYQSYWTPDVAGTPPPYASSGPGYTVERLTWYDMVMAASHLYNQMAATAGVAFSYQPISINGSAVIQPQPVASGCREGADILYAEDAHRGTLRGRVKNGQISGYYFNPWLGKHQSETITTTIGGKSITLPDVQGSVVYAFNDTI